MKGIINIVGLRKQMMICRFESGKNAQYAFIEPLSKEQEDAIEAYREVHNNLCFKKDDKIIADNKNILLYGEINFNNPSDINFIKKFNLVSENGAWIYSSFNYITGTINDDDGKFLQYPTFDAIEWFKYCHCLIGKPERVIVYKTDIKKLKYS